VSAAETDAGWTEVAVSAAKRVDLLALTNGALEELGTTQLAAGQDSSQRFSGELLRRGPGPLLT
jgi:hypothetical protein